MPEITKERLREVFTYNPMTGLFVRNAPTRGCNSKTPVGSANQHGYIRITVDGRRYMAHRLAWLYMTGEWPSESVDHIDGNPANNAWVNLRDVSASVNMQNQRRARRDNRTGLLGVVVNGSGFQARIKVAGKIEILGQFQSKEVAHSAYVARKRLSHPGCAI